MREMKCIGNGLLVRSSQANRLTQEDCGPNFKSAWKAKIPKKIKTFMWSVEQKAILTKDNMLARNWKGDPSCYFCGSPETVEHLFFECPIEKVICGIVAICFNQNCRPRSYDQFWTWIYSALPSGEKFYMFGLSAIWKCRNNICFENKKIKHPGVILMSA
jgi:hypothetical protein